MLRLPFQFFRSGLLLTFVYIDGHRIDTYGNSGNLYCPNDLLYEQNTVWCYTGPTIAAVDCQSSDPQMIRAVLPSVVFHQMSEHSVQGLNCRNWVNDTYYVRSYRVWQPPQLWGDEILADCHSLKILQWNQKRRIQCDQTMCSKLYKEWPKLRPIWIKIFTRVISCLSNFSETNCWNFKSILT